MPWMVRKTSPDQLKDKVIHRSLTIEGFAGDGDPSVVADDLQQEEQP
jgi:hypothetical protein